MRFSVLCCRQRIYSCSLDFFCADKMYPVRAGPALKEDVQVLLKFWALMLSDKKYIKTQIAGGEPSCHIHTNNLLAQLISILYCARLNHDVQTVSSQWVTPCGRQVVRPDQVSSNLGYR